MIIKLKKFGQILTSRNDGREAYLSLNPKLEKIQGKTIINFDEIRVFTPGWGDEFLTPLLKRFGDDLLLKETSNPSIKATLKTLEEANKIKFKKES